ncbi:MAG: single-stranded-DNA-specific exonuclease RecJ [Gemmatimonadetes bacterium]|nr:single-stranded-DNA-specific exonuclease RecJ [Gemmatimonadota bacterium]
MSRYDGPPDAAAVADLVGALSLPEPVCRLLLLRGYGEEAAAKAFLKPRLEGLGSPFGLAGMDAAVARLGHAIERGETILVHGDYDVDGICAATLYTRALRELGARVEPFIPHRLRDGYDLSLAGVRAAAAAGATVILTADCGVVAHEAVVAAAGAGIDVVVTDHHTPAPTLPPAAAVVNPNRRDCAYPEKGLAGTGVAYKVCQALFEARGAAQESLWYYLDLVAIATIADVAPLVGENRLFTRFGLRLLPQTRNLGLRALLRTSGLAERPHLGAGQVSHVLAPRVNAVGRMGEGAWGVKLLLAEDEAEAERLARHLEEENRTRQAVDREMLAQALELLEREYDPKRDYGVVLAAAGWHPGVLGIVASRVAERIHRPTVLIAAEPGAARARGSARSIPSFHLYNALLSCAAHLERFGGHKHAAGLEIRPERTPAFREAFNAAARAVLRPEDLLPELEVDAELTLQEATPELYRFLRHFGPFGVGNPTPVFAARGVTVAGYPRVVGQDHLKLVLAQAELRLPAIGFRMAERLKEVDVARTAIDVAFHLQEDRWGGGVGLQARLLDLRPAA